MSANAPLGSPSRNTGKVDAVCTSATHRGEGAIDVISHADATSFIHIVVLAASQVNHSMRNTGAFSGPKALSGLRSGVPGRVESGKRVLVTALEHQLVVVPRHLEAGQEAVAQEDVA